MANNSLKVSELPIATTAADNDRLVILRQPNSSPSVRTIAISDLTSSLSLAANTGRYTFNDNIMSLSGDMMFINNPNNGIQIGGQWLTQISATQDAGSPFGGGDSESYVWVYQEPSTNSFAGYAEQGVYLQSLNEPGGQFLITQQVLTSNGVNRYSVTNNGALGPLTVVINDSQNFIYGTTPYYSGGPGAAALTSANPLVLRSNSYVTTVINDIPNGFAELWWHNRDGDIVISNSMFLDSDLYVESDGMTLVNAKTDVSNNIISYVWNFDMNGVLNLPSGVGDIQRDGISMLSGLEIDGGSASTNYTAEITVDGGGA